MSPLRVDFPQYHLLFGRQVVFDSFSVNQDHPNLSLRDDGVIDHTSTATFALSRNRPPNLPQASATRNHVSGIGHGDEMLLQRPYSSSLSNARTSAANIGVSIKTIYGRTPMTYYKSMTYGLLNRICGN